MTYPGVGQLYLARRARECARRVDVALVCGVAYQPALVEHHFSRLGPAGSMAPLADAAGCLVLERADGAGRRARARLLELGAAYAPFHPFETRVEGAENGIGATLPAGALGPASLPVFVSLGLGGDLWHEVRTADGIHGWSTWGPA